MNAATLIALRALAGGGPADAPQVGEIIKQQTTTETGGPLYSVVMDKEGTLTQNLSRAAAIELSWFAIGEPVDPRTIATIEMREP